MISGFRREVAENCALLGYNVAEFLNPEDWTDRLSRTSVRNCRYSLHNNPEELSSRSGYFLTHLHTKGKAIPLQVWTDPESSRRLRLPDFMTTAQEGGKFVSSTHRPPLPPGHIPGTHFY